MFKPGQVYYNPVTKSTLLILPSSLSRSGYPKALRIASRIGAPLEETELGKHSAQYLELIGNNYRDKTVAPFKADQGPHLY